MVLIVKLFNLYFYREIIEFYILHPALDLQQHQIGNINPPNIEGYLFTMSAEEVAVESLSERVNNLYNLVFSNNSCEVQNQQPCEVLTKTQGTLKELEVRRNVLTQLWKKLPQLEEFLSADFIQKIGLNEEVKTRLILANEENLKILSKHLQDLKLLQNLANRSALKDTMKNSASLKPLIQIQIDQHVELKETEERIACLLSSYNNIISTVSKQTVLWNNLVTHCELALDMQQDAIE